LSEYQYVSSSSLAVDCDFAGSNPTDGNYSFRVSLSVVEGDYGQVKSREGRLGLVLGLV